MTTDQILDGLISREGGYVNNPADKGGSTKFGITAGTLGQYRGLGRPATVAEVQNLSVTEARAIYAKQYVTPFAAIADDGLKAQLVDIAVTSGQSTAIGELQGALQVPIDGVLGPRTLTALQTLPASLVRQALVARRVRGFLRLAQVDASQKTFVYGWIARAVGFLE